MVNGIGALLLTYGYTAEHEKQVIASHVHQLL
jgi:hypothetical protein